MQLLAIFQTFNPRLVHRLQSTDILYSYFNFSHNGLLYRLLFSCSPIFFLAARPLKCYQCAGSGQECRDKLVSKNSSTEVCKVYEDRCFWGYQRLNSTLELFVMGCNTRQHCKKLPLIGEKAVSSNQLECFDVFCCDSDFCNKPRYTGRYKSWLPLISNFLTSVIASLAF